MYIFYSVCDCMYDVLCVYIMCVYMSTQPMVYVNLGPHVSVLLLSISLALVILYHSFHIIKAMF